MVDTGRARRLGEAIAQIVAEMLERRIKDPRLGFVTVTEARVTGDLREATVYYTVLGDVAEQAATAAALDSAKGLLRSIVGALNQSIKFGAPLAESLRILAAEMRAERLARFEERAARLPVLLTLPLMAFILPSLLLVIGAPLALRIIDMLGRGL